MKNADKPIYPIYKGDNDIISDYGLTKREYFAGLAMQGLILNGFSTGLTCGAAIELADELLKQLES
jgi:hypothetical protein